MTHNFHDRISEGAGEVGGWQTVPIRESTEKLVPIGLGTDFVDIVTSAIYAGEHLHSPYRGDNVIDSAEPIIYVRQSVADRLREAQGLLPEGMRLIVFDGYRSAFVQGALFRQFESELRRLQPDWSKDEIWIETERYVAMPSEDITKPSPHSTGGAVDVAIIEAGRMIEFGTPFDHGSHRSALRYFENDEHVRNLADRLARKNRRLLYNVMRHVGFEGFEHEWWHYNARETQTGARAAGLDQATYGRVDPDSIKRAFLAHDEVIIDGPEPQAPVDRIAPSR